MTEAEWLASADPAEMLRHLLSIPHDAPPRQISDRKLRLFAVACCWRARWFGVIGRVSASPEHVAARLAAAERWIDGPGGKPAPNAQDPSGLSWVLCDDAAEGAREWGQGDWESITYAERAALLREVVGNPWRPVVIERDSIASLTTRAAGPSLVKLKDGRQADVDKVVWLPQSWLTPDVARLAAAAYEGRAGDGALDAGCLLALADALEEAGCFSPDAERSMLMRSLDACFCDDGRDAPECDRCRAARKRLKEIAEAPCLLRHLRDRDPHVRGCFVVDALLGKT